MASLSGWKDIFIRAAAAQDGEALTFAMLYSGVTGAALAILLPALQGVMKVREGLLAWVGGVRHISGALVVIVCAWALSAGCRDLETAHYAVAVLRQGVSVEWVPLAVFVTAGLVAFATGTSYGTMAIIIPTAAQLGYEAGGEAVMILAMAAVPGRRHLRGPLQPHLRHHRPLFHLQRVRPPGARAHPDPIRSSRGCGGRPGRLCPGGRVGSGSLDRDGRGHDDVHPRSWFMSWAGGPEKVAELGPCAR